MAIALDLFLLIAIFYIIYEADVRHSERLPSGADRSQYYSTDESGYYWRSCLIIFVPLVPVAVLLLWPFEGRWKTKRDHFSEEKSCEYWNEVVRQEMANNTERPAGDMWPISLTLSPPFSLSYATYSSVPSRSTIHQSGTQLSTSRAAFRFLQLLTLPLFRKAVFRREDRYS